MNCGSKDAKEYPSILLSDECWTIVLGFCDGKSLANLVQVSRYFYVAGHQPELWRDLVLRSTSSITKVGPSWKDTYVGMVAPDAMTPHRPMSVSGVFSDTLYRLHSCRSFAIPESWYDRQSSSVPRVDADEMTAGDFFEKYERTNLPVVVVGGARSWKATRDWKTPSYCLDVVGDRSFRATSGVAPLPANFTLPAYMDYCRSGCLEEGPLYLFDRTALKPQSTMWTDFMPDLQRSCPYWDPESRDHDFFKVLGEGRRPDHTWLILGPKRSGSVFHIDPNATHAWNAAIVGRKRWIFYPPGVTPPGVLPSEDGDSVALPLSVGEWLFSFWDEHLERTRSAPPLERPLECTTMPGDVCFVPHGWWHMVVNLDDMNIAITHNYVSASNLSNVLRFLDEKEDQISGCRDRQESVKPDALRAEFLRALRCTHRKEVEAALDEKRWTCNAWRSGSCPVNGCVVTPENRDDDQEHCGSVMKRAKHVPGEGSVFSFSFL